MKRIFFKTIIALMGLMPMTAFGQAQTRLTVEDFSIKPGESATLYVDLVNPDMQVWMMQFDMILPEGLSVTTNSRGKLQISGTERTEDHTVDAGLNDGIYTVLVYTSQLYDIMGDSGPVIKISVKAEENYVGGNIKLFNIKVTNLDNDKFLLPDTEGIPSDIHTVERSTQHEAYTLQGIKADTDNLSKGLYIIDGKKVVKN